MADSASPDLLFSERQWVASIWWVTTLVLVCAFVGWNTLLSPPAAVPPWLVWLCWASTGVALPALTLGCRLETIVTRTDVVLRFRPLRARRIAAADVAAAEAVTYRPVKDYGGWGIRGWGDDRAYSVRGNRGVRLELVDGARVLVGTRRPDVLATAVYRMTRTSRSG